MGVDRIAVGDIVKASIKGRVVYGEVLEVTNGLVRFQPLSPAAGWRHATAHDITGHWQKTGTRSGKATDTPAVREQLALPGFYM
jgi:hypothetical protein